MVPVPRRGVRQGHGTLTRAASPLPIPEDVAAALGNLARLAGYWLASARLVHYYLNMSGEVVAIIAVGVGLAGVDLHGSRQD